MFVIKKTIIAVKHMKYSLREILEKNWTRLVAKPYL